MGQVTTEAIIAMPRAEAWAKMRDLSLSPYYVPGVTGVAFTTPQRDGVGASRKILSKGRPPMDETVTAWEEGRGFTLKLHNGDKAPAPFKAAQFRYALEDAPGGQTLFRGTLSYEMPWGALGQLLDTLIFNRLMAPVTAAIGPALKKFYETGKSANPLVA